MKKSLSKIIFFISAFFLVLCFPKAQGNDFYLDNFKVGGYAFSSSKFVTLPTGNFRFSFDLVPYNFQPEQKLYISIVVCSDYDFEGGFGDTGISNISITNTNKSCKYPNSTYSKGRIKIINFNLVTNVGNEFSGGLSVYSPAQFSITLINFNLSASNFVGVNDLPTDIDLTDTNVKIDDTNEKLDNLKDTLKSDDVDDKSSFFTDFSSADHGLSGVITAPLRAVSKITATCQPVTFSVLDEPIELPCGDTLFWNKESVKSFKIVWNLLVGGPLIYFLIKKLFKVIESLKNPDDYRIEVLDL